MNREDRASRRSARALGCPAPVTLGNVVGDTLLVSAMYWLVYLRSARSE